MGPFSAPPVDQRARKPRMSVGIVFVERNGLPRELFTQTASLGIVDRIECGSTHAIGECHPAIRGSKTGIELDGALERVPGRLVFARVVLGYVPEATLVGFPCSEIFRRLAHRALPLDIDNSRPDCCGD